MPSLREALSDAFDKSEADDTTSQSASPAATPPPESRTELTDEGSAPAAGDVAGKESPGADPYKREGEAAGKAESEGKRSPSASEGDTEDSEEEDFEAPVSWRAEIKSAWKALPAQVKAEITRREFDMQRNASENGRIKKSLSEYETAFEPYKELIAQNKSTNLETIKNLMETARYMMLGTPAVKAEVATQILFNYGVDLEELDKALARRLSGTSREPVPRQQSLPPEILDQLNPLLEVAREVRATRENRQRTMQEQVESELNGFKSNPRYPHFEALKEDIADFVEAAAARGGALSLDRAYRKALLLHPELTRGTGDDQAAARAAAAAAVSVSGAKRSVVEKVDPKDLRATIAAQF